MRTMFVSHDKTPSKKKFQKPNILRRKTKVTSGKPNIAEVFESPDVKPLVTTSFLHDPKTLELQLEKNKKSKCHKPCQTVKKSVQRLILDNDISPIGEDNKFIKYQEVETKVNPKNSIAIVGNNVQINNKDENVDQESVNVESFLNSVSITQNSTLFDIETITGKEIENREEQKWCFDFMNDSQKIVIEHCDGSQIDNTYMEQKSDFINNMVPLSAVSSSCQETNHLNEEVASHVTPINNLSIEYFTNSAVKFKCDVPDCNKEFRSEQKLKKHKNVHNKDGSAKIPRQTTVECPVKKTEPDGRMKSCGRIFLIREELIKHLNEDHVPEDAPHRCEECGRRFFWATGLRAHGQAHRARSRALACAWPGCGRVFRLPCRLREHTRAHTGDKPYPCRYPNCGWSFRTRSKLVRHARRHTGERRHACAACGRAFLRREHLRDHAARHHPPHARATHACTHHGCEQTFINMSTLYLHMKKVHRKDEESSSATTTVETPSLTRTDPENMFTVSFMREAGDLEAEAPPSGEVNAGSEWHAARTHCTWPLPPRTDHVYSDCVHSTYVLEEDINVVQSEGSESNIYTVRSDLFLHGNVLNNDDNEHMTGTGARLHEGAVGGVGGVGSVGNSEAGVGGLVLLSQPPLDTDLGLLDTHSTIDLMQDELMYTDAAVDESSFQVLLLSGEELS